jgi:hypothetical protein
MSKIDTIRDRAQRLQEATDRMNAAIDSVESALATTHLGVEAGVHIDEYWMLVYAKVGNKWGLHILRKQEPDSEVPLRNASRVMRLRAAQKLDALLEALIEAAERQQEAVERAAEQYTEFAASTRVAP